MAVRSRIGLCVLCVVVLAGLAVAGGCKKKKDDPFIPPQQTGDAPAADFTANVTSGVAPLDVHFTDKSTGDIDDWSWDLDGDGTPDSTNKNPQHEYTAPGWYTVSLTVTGPEGSDTCTKEMYILVANDIITAGSPTSDYLTIQAAIDAGADYDLVEIVNGTHKGTGNKDLDFGGKSIYLRSTGGATKCTIDCEDSGRGFYFHTNETEDAVVDGFTITNGSIADRGGAIFCYNGACPTIANCTMTGNAAISNSQGGGIALRYSCDATIRDCMITGNSASGAGGGVFCEESDAMFTGCKINNNTTGYSGGGVYCEDSSPSFTDCEIKSNDHSGIRGDTSSPTFTNCVIEGNTASSGGGGSFSYGIGPLFVGCTIKGNSATSGDGGGVRLFSTRKTAAQTFVNCLIQNNSASSDGGGIALDDQARPIIVNCVISGNTAGEDGGGVWMSYRCDAHYVNCVVADNSAAGNGGGLCPETDTDIILDNSIIWGNTATGTGNQIYVTVAGMASSVTLNYCDYANGTNDIFDPSGVTANFCQSVNPVFKDGAYHLSSYSPCIDSGENSLVPGGVTTDLDGSERIVNGTVDIGPYEEQD